MNGEYSLGLGKVSRVSKTLALLDADALPPQHLLAQGVVLQVTRPKRLRHGCGETADQMSRESNG